MQDKTAEGHPIVVRHFATVQDVAACQLLFVPAGEDDELPDLLGKLAGKPVLTVGETDAFCPAGGCMSFYLADNRVRFEISPAATDTAGLKVSAKLMKLARIYTK